MHKEELFLSIDELVVAVNDKVSGKKNPDIPYVGLEHIAPNEPFLITTAPSDTSISTNSVFKQGDILFGKLRPNLRKSLLVLFDGYCSTDILVLRTRSGISPKFAAKVLQSETVFRAVISTSEGTKMPRTSWNKIKILPVFAPKPAEQHILSRILDILDTQIQQTEQLIAKLKQVKVGLLHDLLTRGIDENGEMRDLVAHPENFEESPLGQLPKKWTTRRLKDFYVEPARNGLYKPAKYYGKGNLMIHMPQMFRGLVVNPSDAARVEVTSTEQKRFGLKSGDLVFARRSLNFEGAGRCSIVPDLIEPTTFESSIIRVRLSKHQMRPEFANYFLSSDRGFRQRLPLIRQVAVSGVSSEDIASMLIPCPSIEEQDTIIELIKTHDARISIEEVHLAKLKQIKKGLMHDLLTGRVRVTQLIVESEQVRIGVASGE